MINSGTNLGFYGEYNLVVTKPNGERYETGWFKNVITDIGLDRIGDCATGSAYVIANLRVGTGNSTPAFTNTQLDNQVAASAFYSAVAEARSGYNVTKTFTFAFTQGAVNATIAEIGSGWSTTGATLFSRALILDGSGNPTTLTLTTVDQLTAYYRLTMVPSTSDITGTFTLSGVTYNYTGRPASINSWITGGTDIFPSQIASVTVMGYGAATGGTASVLGAITSTPTFIVYDTGSSSVAAYTAGTRYRDVTLSFGINQWNGTGGIKTMLIVTANAGSYFQYEITPPIPKDNTKTLSFSIRYSWNRV